MKASNSSTDSGSGSGGAFGAAGGAGGRGAGVETVETPDWGEAMVCWRAGTAWGSSIVEEAMSSSLAVAASSL